MSEAAFRAAGQAVAALWQGAPIDHVDIDGIALDSADPPTPEQAREQATIEIAIGLTGIAAQERYRFGWVPDHEFIGSWQFNEWQLEDFRLVRDLVAEVDMGDVDVLYRSWCRALEFVNDLAIWSAIESVAETLGRQWLGATQVEKLAANAFWNNVVIAPAIADPKNAAGARIRKSELGQYMCACVIQTLLPDRSHPSLGDRIGL